MAMGTLSEGEDDFNPEINTTPLVDVMLVLLIIFIITIPVINHAVKVDLPRASSQQELKPDNINVTIDAAGQVYWNEQVVDSLELEARIADAARIESQPELHLQVERTAQFEKVAQVMAAAQSGGLGKIGFVTEAQEK